MYETESNQIVDLAKRARSNTIPGGAVYSLCNSNGAWFSDHVARRYYEEVWEILAIVG